MLQVVSLITIEVHARDVIEKLGKVGCTNANDFEWVSQLRFYWDKDQNDCIVKQASQQQLPFNVHVLGVSSQASLQVNQCLACCKPQYKGFSILPYLVHVVKTIFDCNMGKCNQAGWQVNAP